MCFTFIKYTISTQVYSADQQVVWEKNLNGFSIHNTGTTQLLFNQDLLEPGESKTIGGNIGEVFEGRIFLTFQTQTPAPPVIINQVTVTQKYYVGDRL